MNKLPTMIPAGYMAKKIVKKPDWLNTNVVMAIYSVSNCISENFANYINFWKYNKYWFFDSIDIIKEISKENNIDLSKTELLYYEIYEKEFDEDKGKWVKFEGEKSFGYDMQIPKKKLLLSYDVINYTARTTPECSVFSCNSLAENVTINKYCLMDSFEETIKIVETLDELKCEPGPYRILAVYKI